MKHPSAPPPPKVFWLTSVCFLTFLLRPQRATSMADVARDAHVVGCSAWRRRNRRLRAFWRHEQQAVRMAVAAATHHSYDTQTDLEYVTPAPVIECVAPAPAGTYVVHSQQLLPVYTTTTVTTDDNLDMISLVYPQFSSTAVEPFAPLVVDSLLPLEEFTEPVYDQVHQEQIAASEMTENTIGAKRKLS